MLIIKAEQFYSQNSMDWSEIKQYDVYSEGLVKFKTLVDAFGEKDANLLVDSLKIDKIELELQENEGYDIYCQLPAAKIITLDDVLVLLDPLPENLLTFYNKGKDFKRDTTAITGTNSLARLKLNIDSVLKGESENGLASGEGNLLKLYAHEIGYDEKNWPSWLKLAP